VDVLSVFAEEREGSNDLKMDFLSVSSLKSIFFEK